MIDMVWIVIFPLLTVLKISGTLVIKKSMTENKRINLFCFILVGSTLLATVIATSATPSNFIILLICFMIAIKGRFVIDEFMVLREAIPIIRYTISFILYFSTSIYCSDGYFPGIIGAIDND